MPNYEPIESWQTPAQTNGLSQQILLDLTKAYAIRPLSSPKDKCHYTPLQTYDRVAAITFLTAPGTCNIRDSMYTCTFNLKNSTIMKTKQIINQFYTGSTLTTD